MSFLIKKRTAKLTFVCFRLRVIKPLDISSCFNLGATRDVGWILSRDVYASQFGLLLVSWMKCFGLIFYIIRLE